MFRYARPNGHEAGRAQHDKPIIFYTLLAIPIFKYHNEEPPTPHFIIHIKKIYAHKKSPQKFLSNEFLLIFVY